MSSVRRFARLPGFARRRIFEESSSGAPLLNLGHWRRD